MAEGEPSPSAGMASLLVAERLPCEKQAPPCSPETLRREVETLPNALEPSRSVGGTVPLRSRAVRQRGGAVKPGRQRLPPRVFRLPVQCRSLPSGRQHFPPGRQRLVSRVEHSRNRLQRLQPARRRRQPRVRRRVRGFGRVSWPAPPSDGRPPSSQPRRGGTSHHTRFACHGDYSLGAPASRRRLWRKKAAGGTPALPVRLRPTRPKIWAAEGSVAFRKTFYRPRESGSSPDRLPAAAGSRSAARIVDPRPESSIRRAEQTPCRAE